MPRARKNSIRPEQVRKSKRRPAKLEPLHPKTVHPDKLRDEMAKFLSECSYPVLRIHKDGTVKFANKAGESLLEAKDSGIGRPVPSEWRLLTEEIFSSGREENYETEHNGRVFGFRAVPIVDSGYVNFYGMDVTEFKLAEEALRKSEYEKTLILDNASEIIAYHDINYNILWANRAYLKATGLSLSQIQGKKCYHAWGLDKLCKGCPVTKTIETGEPQGAELTPQNQPHWPPDLGSWLSRAAPVKDKAGSIIGAIEVAYDISERKQAEQSLRESASKFRIIADNTYDWEYWLDPQGRFIYCSPSCEWITGHSVEEFLADPSLRKRLIHPDDRERFEAHLKDVEHAQAVGEGEWRFVRPDGTFRWVAHVCRPVFDEMERFLGIRGSNRDITERKRAEHKLIEYQKQLKKLASRLALTEERERRRIARNLHDQVSQSLALAKIKLDTMLASEKASPLAETLKETNDTIEKAIQNTRSLTFDLSYPILYELGFEEAVSEWLREQVKEKYPIFVDFEDDGLAKPLDDDVRVLLFRNVRELLINIIKHARADKIKVSIAKTDDSIKITIKDNGIGFNVEDTTASRKGGFGLFSIRESIGELGGSFEIESKPGAGCKVTMTAPLKGKRQTKE